MDFFIVWHKKLIISFKCFDTHSHIFKNMITSVSCLMLIASVARTLDSPVLFDQVPNTELYKNHEGHEGHEWPVRPLIFDVDGSFFAILKSDKHFEYLPCFSPNTHVAFFDPSNKYTHQVDTLLMQYNHTPTVWKYLSSEQELYDWFLWWLYMDHAGLQTKNA